MLVGSLLILSQQKTFLREKSREHALKELSLMGEASFEAVLKHDYVTVRSLVKRWAEEHDEYKRLVAVAPNGFVIGEHVRPIEPGAPTFTLTRTIRQGDKELMTVVMVGDYSDADEAVSRLRIGLIAGSVLFLSLLGFALWVSIKKMALLPMEYEITFRKKAEEDLMRSNEALEERVKERTLELRNELIERLKTEEELRSRQEHIRLLLNSTAEGIYGIDIEGKCTFCNAACLRLLGYQKDEELLGKKMHPLIHDTYADGRTYPEEECRVCGAFRKGEGIHDDSEVFWRPDRSRLFVEYWSYPVFEGEKITGAVVTFIDKTEQRKAEAFITNILETVDEGFLVIDRDFRILSANKAYSKQVDLPLEEIIGKHCYEISHGAFRPCYKDNKECVVQKTFETGEPHSSVHLHKDAMGTMIKIESKSYPIRDHTGTIVSAIETITDISEKSRLEEQLRQSQKMEAIGQLAGGIAHDFNNYLTAIIGYAGLLQAGLDENSRLRSYGEQILLSSERAANLTKQILAFGRKQMIDVREEDLNEIIRDMEGLTRRLLGEDIEITMRLSRGKLTVMVDPGQIEQVLMNLFTNARDAMPKGGHLVITTEAREITKDHPLAMDIPSPGHYALLIVSDTGTGMDERTKEKIFEPFFTTKEMGRGTGLGLAIVYGIIRQHNGHISVYSEAGRGASFRIYLPLCEERKTGRGAKGERSPEKGTETILLAEDDPEVRNLARHILQEFGYRVIEARDGEDAIRKFDAHPESIDLCVLDMIMPKMSGKEIYEVLRERRPGVRVLYTSGYTAEIIKERGALSEDEHFLQKPFSPGVFLNTVRQVLDRSA